MTRRSRRLHALARVAAQASGAVYVNGYKDRASDPFVREAQRLNARDGLHPSDDGYWLWFRKLEQQAGLSRRLQDLCGERTTASPPGSVSCESFA